MSAVTKALANEEESKDAGEFFLVLISFALAHTVIPITRDDGHESLTGRLL